MESVVQIFLHPTEESTAHNHNISGRMRTLKMFATLEAKPLTPLSHWLRSSLQFLCSLPDARLRSLLRLSLGQDEVLKYCCSCSVCAVVCWAFWTQESWKWTHARAGVNVLVVSFCWYLGAGESWRLRQRELPRLWIWFFVVCWLSSDWSLLCPSLWSR